MPPGTLPSPLGCSWGPRAVCAQVLGAVRQREVPAKGRCDAWSPSRGCPLAWPRAHGRFTRTHRPLLAVVGRGACPGQWLLQTPKCLTPHRPARAHAPALWLVVTRGPAGPWWTRLLTPPDHGLPAPESSSLRSPSLFHFPLRLHNCLENCFFLERSFPQSPGAGRSRAARLLQGDPGGTILGVGAVRRGRHRSPSSDLSGDGSRGGPGRPPGPWLCAMVAICPPGGWCQVRAPACACLPPSPHGTWPRAHRGCPCLAWQDTASRLPGSPGSPSLPPLRPGQGHMSKGPSSPDRAGPPCPRLSLRLLAALGEPDLWCSHVGLGLALGGLRVEARTCLARGRSHRLLARGSCPGLRWATPSRKPLTPAAGFQPTTYFTF